MTDLRKAAEMALDYIRREGWTSPKGKEVWEALRQALEQPEHEPVGWYDSISGLMDFTFYRPVRKPSSPSAEWVPVYAAPTKREWVGLTDEELREAYCKVSGKEWCLGGLANAHTFYEAIEAKLKEKNT